VCEGRSKSAGDAAVELLVDERKVSFDGLAAASDYMALGAIPRCRADLQVPSDVAVVASTTSRTPGFDAAADDRPAPLYSKASGARLVLARIDSAEVAPGPPPPPSVMRLSCGCLSG
jgi:hypothetical protein